MKKKIIIPVVITISILVLFVGGFMVIFKYYHPTHFKYNDRFIIGNTEQEIIQKYGEFDRISKNNDNKTVKGTYMIRDDTPELIMGYDNSLWYNIIFENGIAVNVYLQEGYIGG